MNNGYLKLIKMPRCKNKDCREKFEPKKFLQKFCLKPECISLMLVELKAKGKKEKDKEWSKEKKVMKEKLKTLGDYEKEAKKEFQKWIRLRDKDLPCQACLTPFSNEWHGSHLFKAEIYSGVIFDERNVWKCCKKCNVFLGGNELQFRANLERRFGKEWVDKLQADANETRNKRFTKTELLEIKNFYKIKLKNLA
jgi:hypothetical protein